MTLSAVSHQIVTLDHAKEYLKERQLDQDHSDALQRILNGVHGFVYQYTQRKALLATEPVITSVVQHMRGQYGGSGPLTQQVGAIIVLDDVVWYGSKHSLTDSWAQYTESWTVSPATTLPWTWDELRSMTGGLHLAAVSATDIAAQCTQFYYEIKYEGGSIILRPTADGTGSLLGIKGNGGETTNLWQLVDDVTADDDTGFIALNVIGDAQSGDYYCSVSDLIPYGAFVEYVGGNGPCVELHEYPIVSLDEVEIWPHVSGSEITITGPGTSLSNSDMYWEADPPIVTLKTYSFPDQRNTAKVTYRAGYAEGSPEISSLRLAMLELTQFHWMRFRNKDAGIESRKKSAESVTFREEDIDPSVLRQLWEFRRLST